MKSKLFLPSLLALSIFHLSLGVGAAADAITLSNPGFENQLDGWENQEDNGMSKAVTEAAHTGKFGLRVADDSEETGSAIYSQKIPVSAGKTYEVQFWARNVSGTGIGVYLRFVKADGRLIVPTSEDEKIADRNPVVEVNKTQTEWKQLSGKKVAPSEAVALMIYIHSYSKHKVIADFDDFSLSEVAN